MTEFQRALEREIAVHRFSLRTIGTWHWPYPTLPLFSTAEQKVEMHREFERLVRAYDEEHTR